MEQYNSEDKPSTTARVDSPGQDMNSLSTKVRRLEELMVVQQNELMRLSRELGRIKNDVTDLIGLIRRG